MTNPRIAIIGGGISGLCTALALQKQGIQASIYEIKNDIAETETGMVLTGNAIRALFIMGLGKQILKHGIATDTCLLKSDSGEIIAEFDYRSPSRIPNYLFVQRSALTRILLAAIAPSTIHFNKGLGDFNEEQDMITLHFSDGTQETVDYLIACDGAGSIIRKKLIPERKSSFTGTVCWRGITDFTFSRNVSFSETWGSRGRFGIAPVLPGNHLYWYALIKSAREKKDLESWSPIDILFNFFYYHDPIQQILENTSPENIIFDELYEMKLDRTHYGKILFIGDSAHLSLPSIGQGASRAVEDAVFLTKWIMIEDSIDKAFASYDQHRQERTEMIESEMKVYSIASELNFPFLCSARNKLLQWAPTGYHNDKLRKIVEIEGL